MARDIAKTQAYQTSRCQRKKVEMLFAHLKRILKLEETYLRSSTREFFSGTSLASVTRP